MKFGKKQGLNINFLFFLTVKNEYNGVFLRFVGLPICFFALRFLFIEEKVKEQARSRWYMFTTDNKNPKQYIVASSLTAFKKDEGRTSRTFSKITVENRAVGSFLEGA